MNGEVCCVLGICCPPGSDAQTRALAKELVKDQICPDDSAHAVAAWVLKHFDLAPAGTLSDFKSRIATVARQK